MKLREELQLRSGSRVVVRRVDGDLKLRSQEGGRLTVLSREGQLTLTRDARAIVIECREDCRIRLPADTEVVIETVGGDAAIGDLERGTEVGNVGGDLSLRRCGSSLVRGVGGDLLAKDIQGDLSVKTVGGDCWIGRIGGQTRVEAVGGDGSFNRLGGSLRAMVGGDATVNLLDGVRGSINVNAGGDVACRLPQDASARMNLSAGADIRSKMEEAAAISGRSGSFVLREGDREVSLSAGGSLWIGYESEGPQAGLDSLGADLATKIEGMMVEAEASLAALGEQSIEIDGEGIAERVRRIVDRAIRRGARGEKLSAVESAVGDRIGRNREDPVSDEERLQVLRMVEENKITIEEAEALLDALGGSS